MWIVKLAWKNLWRNRSRTMITVAAIFFAVILSTLTESLRQGIFDNLIRNVVSFYSGYIQVHKQGYEDEKILDNSFTQSNELERKILADKNVSGMAARLESFALAASEDLTKGCMVAGVEPEKEDKITALKSKLIDGAYLDENDQAVLLAEGLAGRLKLKTGDTIVLIGQGYHGATAAGKYQVKGILKFGSPQLNDKILYMSLPAAQELFSADGMLTSYVLSLKDEEELQNTDISVKQAIGNEYEVMTWEELMPDIWQHITSDTKSMRVIQGILYLLISFGIFSTLLMMLLERKYEMGMLVAIGMKKTKLGLMFVMESVMTALIGCVAGIITSIPLVIYLNRKPIRIGGETAAAYERFGFEAIFPSSTEPMIFLYQAMIVMIIGLALSLYPVIKVMRLRPVNAMKK